MQQFLQSTHSIIRWLVLLGGILAIVIPYLSSNVLARTIDRLPALAFVIICDIQILIGFPLYFGYSGYGASAFHNGIDNVMKNEDIFKIAVEHFGLTFIGIIIVHVGYFKIRKLSDMKPLKKTSLIYFGFAILLILAAVPWYRIIV